MKIHCDEILSLNPGIIFHPTNLNQLTINSLKDILGSKNGFVMAEVEVWTNVVRWGISQVDEHLNEINAYHWGEEDFMKLRDVICDILPHIRFRSISTSNFYHYVAPFARVIGEEVYHELLKYHLVASYRPDPNIICPLGDRTGQYGSVYFNPIFASLISSWVDNHPQIFYNRKTTYDFKLLFKASRDGFRVQDFYAKCSFVMKTLLLIKIKGYDNLIGGFNPNYWVDGNAFKTRLGAHLETPYSFLFNLNRSSPQVSILSRVAGHNKATFYHPDSGPNFNDLKLCPSGFDNLQQKSVDCHYFFTGFYYQNNIGLTNSVFQIEDYEIFILSRKTPGVDWYFK
nr:9608_t:CDS:2 [Entrophospora candida]